MMFKRFLILALSGSSVLMAGALLFQYVGDMTPCKMCYWQRYPHIGAIVLALILLLRPLPYFAWLGSFLMLMTAGIGGYHSGVEQGWWEGPKSCTSASIENMSTDDLLEQIMTSPVVRCDDIAWSLVGLSMASWNMLLSLILAFVWLKAAITHRSA